MTGALAVTATFLASSPNLAVTKSGEGSGLVTSSPVGITCGTDCSERYGVGTSVTLTATASTGSVFSGWGGACTGTGTCTIALANLDDKAVTASFGPRFVQQRWASRKGAFGVDQKWLAGDFNGDGRSDLAVVFNDGGYASFDVHLSNGTGFPDTGWDRWANRKGAFGSGQTWTAGDFNGDGLADIALVFNDGGYASVDVHLSNGTGFPDTGWDRWANRKGAFGVDQKWLAGDFNRDGRSDLAVVFNDGGYASVDVHLAR